MPTKAAAARARAARDSIASSASGGAKSGGSPQASTCPISPWLLAGAWISALGTVVNPAALAARVGDREAVPGQEVVREAQEVAAHLAAGPVDLARGGSLQPDGIEPLEGGTSLMIDLSACGSGEEADQRDARMATPYDRGAEAVASDVASAHGMLRDLRAKSCAALRQTSVMAGTGLHLDAPGEVGSDRLLDTHGSERD